MVSVRMMGGVKRADHLLDCSAIFFVQRRLTDRDIDELKEFLVLCCS